MTGDAVSGVDSVFDPGLLLPEIEPRPRLAVRLFIVLLFVGSILALVWAWVTWANLRFEPPPARFIRGPAVVFTESLLVVAFSGLGALLARSEHRNPIGWLFLFIGVTTALQLPVTFLVATAHEALRQVSPPVHIAAWVVSSFHLPLAAAVTVWVFLLFPDGHMPGPRWRYAGWAAALGAGLISASIALAPEGLLWYPSLANPFGAPPWWSSGLSVVALVGLAFLLGGLFGSTSSMIVRYRTAEPIRRLQLRWIAYAVVAASVVGAPFLVVRYAMDMSDDAGEWFLVAMVSGAALLPISATIAILRHRLFDIDKLINRTLVYVPLTAILTGLYAASVSLFQRIFVAATGDTSDAAIVFTTLILASAFTPVRKSLEGVVDRYLKPHPAEPAAQTHTHHADEVALSQAGAAALASLPPDSALDAVVRALASRVEELEKERSTDAAIHTPTRSGKRRSRAASK